MEDSMVINKTSYERGFAQASILKCEVPIHIQIMRENIHFLEYRFFVQKIDLVGSVSRMQHVRERLMFNRDPTKPELVDFIDTDGLPYIGKQYREHDPIYW